MQNFFSFNLNFIFRFKNRIETNHIVEGSIFLALLIYNMKMNMEIYTFIILLSHLCIILKNTKTYLCVLSWIKDCVHNILFELQRRGQASWYKIRG